jgi:hypothetical protein
VVFQQTEAKTLDCPTQANALDCPADAKARQGVIRQTVGALGDGLFRLAFDDQRASPR